MLALAAYISPGRLALYRSVLPGLRVRKAIHKGVTSVRATCEVEKPFALGRIDAEVTDQQGRFVPLMVEAAVKFLIHGVLVAHRKAFQDWYSALHGNPNA